MGRRTMARWIPDQPGDPDVTRLDGAFRPPQSQVNPATGAPVDGYRNRNVANTTPIQLVGGAASVRVLPANPRRTGLLIQNKDTTADLFIGFGNAADASSISVAAGGYILLDFTTPASEVYAFAVANVQAVFVDMSRGP